MNQQRKDQIKQYFFEKFYFAGEKHLACARDRSRPEIAQVSIRDAASNYRKALVVLGGERADFVARHEAERLKNKVWDKYDQCWIGSKDDGISLTDIIEREVDRRLSEGAQKRGVEVKSNIKEFKSGLNMGHVSDMVIMRCCADEDYDIVKPPDLSLLTKFTKDLVTKGATNMSSPPSAKSLLRSSRKKIPPCFVVGGDSFEDEMDINDDVSDVHYDGPSRIFQRETRNGLIINARKNDRVPMDVTDVDGEDDKLPTRRGSFVTARSKYVVGSQKQGYHSPSPSKRCLDDKPFAPGVPKKKMTGALSQSIKKGKFVSPLLKRKEENSGGGTKYRRNEYSSSICKRGDETEEEIDERLKNIDPKMIELIQNEIMDRTLDITWEDIAGLEHAKKTIQEAPKILMSSTDSDIFKGLRGPPKGLLLFGPPGTGKTLIGKSNRERPSSVLGGFGSQNENMNQFELIVANKLYISSSSLTSKWVGDGEKMVRALFAVARVNQPAVVFVDERTDGEFEASRRIKTEFLDGVKTAGLEEDRILIVGATNRPQEIDEAARRRFRKRLYIPLPEDNGRYEIIKNLLKAQKHSLTDEEIRAKKHATSLSPTIRSIYDKVTLVPTWMDFVEAALGPIRVIGDIRNIAADDVRPINYQDFLDALTQVRASVSDRDLELYQKWNQEYGSLS
ncbi:12607_t:CDS:10 [Acaulospora colombiana]|uniref:12607_t:CDS:1 n=1 Tax=Acaulospora colombiana TaxID=27376 RepID=A0ACA9KFZ2_9GLOM|nr:12607_t:CDS:10 [Acaulospora colombiana]